MAKIDITFDFRSDSNGKDPDSASKTLRSYHKTLWTKALPNGSILELDDNKPGKYLTAMSNSRIMQFSSDSISNSYANSTHKEIVGIIQKINLNELNEFVSIGNTIGGYLIFPSNRIDNLATINGARGLSNRIADRFDITLECIKRHYKGQQSPLSDALKRYSDFFELFKTFGNYVDFFLLQDLIDEESQSIKYFSRIDPDFATSGYPRDVNEYLEYKENTMNFVNARNLRILNNFT